jgi:tRNA pseudouridine38-40 synthase
MNLACDPLIGEHDFSTFCRRPPLRPDGSGPTRTRRVISARWFAPSPTEQPELLRFEIRANAFCHQMVRSITGTLVDIGSGKCSPGDMMGILNAKDRAVAGQVAPPNGLCLWEVGYPDA